MSEPTSRVSVTLTSTRLASEYTRLQRALATPIELGRIALAHFEPVALEQAREFWRARMAAEHRSVQVFTQLALQLLEAGAPHDAKTLTLRMAQDELLHTDVCAQVSSWLGGDATCEHQPEIEPIARHAGCTLQQRALRNVVYATCLSEMVAVARLTDCLEHTTVPGARSAVRSILADEVLHGQFGFLYLDAVEASDEDRADLADYLVHAFAVLEAELAPSQSKHTPPPHPEAMSLGVISAPRAYAVFYGAIEAAIVPGLEARGVAAGRAWSTRRRQR